MRILELFGGIGACSKALEKLGVDYEIVDYVEIDKYAVKSFNAIHNTNFEPQDITTWDKDIQVDLIMHGSPCQDFSLAGKQAGGDENSGTRSSLMYETLRIVENLKPKYVIWENVKNILSVKHKHNFDNYLKQMEELGYKNYYQVLNAKNYGIPQNRERVFTVSVRNDITIDKTVKPSVAVNFEREKENIIKSNKEIYQCECESGWQDNKIGLKVSPTIRANNNNTFILEDNRYFEFPPKQELKLKLKDILEKTVNEKYYLSDTQIKRIETTTYNVGKTRIQKKDWCDTLCARDWKDPKCVEIKEAIKIRKLTPKECWRLMGFDDEDFEKASRVNSNTQLYKQAGNSIVVNVLMAILKELL